MWFAIGVCAVVTFCVSYVVEKFHEVYTGRRNSITPWLNLGMLCVMAFSIGAYSKSRVWVEELQSGFYQAEGGFRVYNVAGGKPQTKDEMQWYTAYDISTTTLRRWIPILIAIRPQQLGLVRPVDMPGKVVFEIENGKLRKESAERYQGLSGPDTGWLACCFLAVFLPGCLLFFYLLKQCEKWGEPYRQGKEREKRRRESCTEQVAYLREHMPLEIREWLFGFFCEDEQLIYDLLGAYYPYNEMVWRQMLTLHGVYRTFTISAKTAAHMLSDLLSHLRRYADQEWFQERFKGVRGDERYHEMEGVLNAVMRDIDKRHLRPLRDCGEVTHRALIAAEAQPS